MFRPRLSEEEIRFLLGIIRPKKCEIENQYEEVSSKYKQEIAELQTALKTISQDANGSNQDETEQKRKRLDFLQNETLSIWNQLVFYQGLCVRFQDLLGHKKRGRMSKQLEPEHNDNIVAEKVEPEPVKTLEPVKDDNIVIPHHEELWEILEPDPRPVKDERALFSIPLPDGLTIVPGFSKEKKKEPLFNFSKPF